MYIILAYGKKIGRYSSSVVFPVVFFPLILIEGSPKKSITSLGTGELLNSDFCPI